MFNAFLHTFTKHSENKTFWIFVTRKEKISFQFPHSESSLHSEFLLCLWYLKGIWSHRKTFWKTIQNEKCWTFQKLSERKCSELWALAWNRFSESFRKGTKVHWTFTYCHAKSLIGLKAYSFIKVGAHSSKQENCLL